MNDVLVIYIDGQSGGSTSTANFTDKSNNLTTAISGYGGTGKRSTFNFASGFTLNMRSHSSPAKVYMVRQLLFTCATMIATP